MACRSPKAPGLTVLADGVAGAGVGDAAVVARVDVVGLGGAEVGDGETGAGVAGVGVVVATSAEGPAVGVALDATVAAVAWTGPNGIRPKRTRGAAMLNAAMITSDRANKTARTLFFMVLPPIAGGVSQREVAPDKWGSSLQTAGGRVDYSRIVGK